MTGKGATYETVREKITEEQYSYYISELLTIPEKMKKILEDKERIQWFAAKYANAHDVFFVGRGIDYAVCLEGTAEPAGQGLYDRELRRRCGLRCGESHRRL